MVMDNNNVNLIKILSFFLPSKKVKSLGLPRKLKKNIYLQRENAKNLRSPH